MSNELTRIGVTVKYRKVMSTLLQFLKSENMRIFK